MDDWYFERQITYFSNTTVAVTFFVWLKYDNNPHMWSKLAKIGLIFIIVTCVMTIIASEINPMVVRASYSSGREEIVNFLFYRKMGIGSYGFITAITLLFPTLIYLFKQKNNKKSRRMIVVVMVILYTTLLKAQIFANIIVASFAIILSVNPKIKLKQIYRYIFFFIILIIIPNSYWSTMFAEIATVFKPESILSNKFTDLSNFLLNFQIQNTSGMEIRIARYPMLWDVFSASPLFGDSISRSSFGYEMDVGGHLFWMSRLALWGVFGFIFFIWLLNKNFKEVFYFFGREFRFYYLISIISFIALGLMKNLNFIESFLVLFLIIPGLYLDTAKNNPANPIREKSRMKLTIRLP